MNTPKAPLTMTDYGANFGEILFSLMAVIALIFLLVFFLKKISFSGFSKSQHISVVTELPISSKDKLMIVQAGEEQFLVGVSPGYIGKISRLKTPVLIADKKPMASEAFDKFLSKAIKSEKSTDE